ncbi:hypothetical protein G6F42_013913 [Rhizopus arrhizus]|nr:hypothetical protein G6F42_013913 [Rhizopus arrhizus]
MLNIRSIHVDWREEEHLQCFSAYFPNVLCRRRGVASSIKNASTYCIIVDLLTRNDAIVKKLKHDIRSYNYSALSFTSMNADLDRRYANEEHGAYAFRIHRSVHHRMIPELTPNLNNALQFPKPNWENISADIIDRMVRNGYEFQTKRKTLPIASVTISASSSIKDNILNDSISAKIVKLNDNDKSKIAELYNGLDDAKMRKLSTGMIVEDKMKQFALSRDHEHGEKCSKDSADAANINRSISDLSRQQAGQKMDDLFNKTKDDSVEIGCGECALVGGVNTTKELNDASFKMPKVMKDMAYKIVALSPGIKHTLLVITGVYIGEDKLKLVTLDFPRGYNARYDAFDPVIYPMSESKTRRRLARVLKMTYPPKLSMNESLVEAVKLDQGAKISAAGFLTIESSTKVNKFTKSTVEIQPVQVNISNVLHHIH